MLLLFFIQICLCVENICMHPHPTSSTARNMFSDERLLLEHSNQTNRQVNGDISWKHADTGQKTQNPAFNQILKTNAVNRTLLNKTYSSSNLESIHSILPADWQKFCSLKYKFVSGDGLNFTSQWALYVSCDLGKDDHWSLQEYREWILTNEKTVYKHLPIKSDLLLAFDFKCYEREGSLSLPWPVRGKYLWYIAANNCTLIDHYTEFKVTHNVKDYLSVMEIADCNQIMKEDMFMDFLINSRKQSRHFKCGGEEMERYVFRNVSKTFSDPHVSTDVKINRFKSNFPPVQPRMLHFTKLSTETMVPSMAGETSLNQPELDSQRTLNESQLLDAIANFSQNNQKLKHQCFYKRWQYIDVSYSDIVAKHHTNLMTEGAQWPELQYFNMSHSNLKFVPPHFLEWRRYFTKMKYVDLSYNRIKYISALSDNGIYNDHVGVIDLRYNNFTALTKEDIETLSINGRSVIVDLRNNPYVCDCKMTSFVEQAKNFSRRIFPRYKYLNNLTCSAPQQHAGKKIASLDTNFCETIEIILMTVPLIIICCFTALIIMFFILSVRYRKEIVILAFTRLNISLPCRNVTKNVDKRYDAFIAYSEQDGVWVFNTLLPRLETPRENNGPGLKLCIHHRDFPVGGCIADNILDKVKDSRHTVLILSNNFLRSHWCKYEFKAAFTQSLMEKKQHLIMVIKEELDKHLIDPALKRCLKTFTYVKTDDRLFWDKIIYALSDLSKQSNKDINFNTEENYKIKNKTTGYGEKQNRNVNNINDGVWVINKGLNNQKIEENNADRALYQNKKHVVYINQHAEIMQDGVWNI